MRQPFEVVLSALLLTAIFLLPSSCSRQEVYQGAELPYDGASVVKTGGITLPGLGFRSTYFRKVDDMIMPSFINEVKVPPGDHAFYLEGSAGLSHYDRQIEFATEAGREYKIYIRNSGKNVWAEDVQTGKTIAGNKAS